MRVQRRSRPVAKATSTATRWGPTDRLRRQAEWEKSQRYARPDFAPRPSAPAPIARTCMPSFRPPIGSGVNSRRNPSTPRVHSRQAFHRCRWTPAFAGVTRRETRRALDDPCRIVRVSLPVAVPAGRQTPLRLEEESRGDTRDQISPPHPSAPNLVTKRLRGPRSRSPQRSCPHACRHSTPPRTFGPTLPLQGRVESAATRRRNRP
jgi:hypothetical protein